jgi:two-component system CheB/CheR fusion protein
MGGEIGVNSTPGRGSTFWLKVPFDLADAAASPGEPQLTEAPPPPPAPSSAQILIVEDHLDNREILVLLLESIGYRPDAVGSGRECLERVAQQDYDIILMDCQMAGLDGYETTRRLRELEGDRRHTIVVAVTAHAMKGDREKCLEAGMDDYMSKPIMEEDLARMVEKWVPRE